MKTITELEALGYCFTLDGDRLRFTHPGPSPDPAAVGLLMAALKADKPAAVDWLRQRMAALPPSPAPPAASPTGDDPPQPVQPAQAGRSRLAQAKERYRHLRERYLALVAAEDGAAARSVAVEMVGAAFELWTRWARAAGIIGKVTGIFDAEEVRMIPGQLVSIESAGDGEFAVTVDVEMDHAA